jgi:hypothetical protein
MKLIRGRQYDVSKLEFRGWTKGDGSSTAGYNLYDYFRAGVYLGPDEHRIAPLVKRRNPSRRLTKTQRRRNASTRAKQKRMTVALRKFLQSVKPGSKATAAAVRKNPGGSITIIPLKVKTNRARRAR